jgi:hypothetical protein
VKQSAYTVGIVAGDGLVVRAGDVVMYIGDGSLAADSLIGAVEAAAHTDHPGGAVAERLAALAFGNASAPLAPFGVVAPTKDGVVLLLRGNVTAKIDAPDGIREVAGSRALTWVDEVLPASTKAVEIGSRSGLAAVQHTDLGSGVVPGGGFVFRSSNGDAKSRSQAGVRGEAQPRPEAGVRGEAQPPPETNARHSAMVTNPAYISRPPTAQTEPAPSTLQVPAVPHRPTPSETSTLAPVTGVLETDDDAIYPLDRPYVIGRDPLNEESVRNAQASPIVIREDKHVSRVHAFVTIDSGSVYVRDADTPGGTFIAAPGADDWTQIGSKATELEPGWSLRVGARVLKYRAEEN